MKKYNKVFSTVIVFCLLLGIVGCGKDSATDEKETDSISQEASSESSSQDAEDIKITEAGTVQPFSATRIKHKIQTDDLVYNEDKNEEFPFAYVTYETYEISDEMQKLYPELSQALLTRSEWNEEDALKTLASQAKEYQEINDDFGWMYVSNYLDKSTMVQRADDKVLSVLVTVDSFFNGPHPFTYWESYTYDTQTGEQIPLSDIVTDIRALPQLLLDNLQPVDETYEFSDEEKEDMLGKIEEYVANNELCWVLTDEAFAVFFDAYDLQYYAFGPIFVSLTYEDFPELLQPQYRFTGDGADGSDVDRFPAEDTGMKNYSWDKLEKYYEEYAQENGYSMEDGAADSEEIREVFVENPGWAYYLKDSSVKTQSKAPYKLKQTDKKSIVLADTWSDETGISLPLNTWQYPYYQDGKYLYYIHREDPKLPYVTVSSLDGSYSYGNYFFSNFLNPPDTNMSSSFADVTDMDILYAEAEDGILYAELGHRTYASAQPHTAYIVAIDLETEEVLWRSKDQVASAYDILILGDTIVCGYGFTDEKDYIYILDRNTGDVLDSYPVDSAPDYLIHYDNTLYCVTYGSAYAFEILYD